MFQIIQYLPSTREHRSIATSATRHNISCVMDRVIHSVQSHYGHKVGECMPTYSSTPAKHIHKEGIYSISTADNHDHIAIYLRTRSIGLMYNSFDDKLITRLTIVSNHASSEDESSDEVVSEADIINLAHHKDAFSNALDQIALGSPKDIVIVE